MITRRVTVVERLVPKPVRKAVDTEGALLDKKDAEDACVNESALTVILKTGD